MKWNLSNIGHPKNFYALFESGVYNLLINISSKHVVSIAPAPSRIGLHGNIVKEFSILGLGLGVALFCYFLECSVKYVEIVSNILVFNVNYSRRVAKRVHIIITTLVLNYIHQVVAMIHTTGNWLLRSYRK